MASDEVLRPEPRELRACGLAALAEAGVLALPVWLVLTETRGLEVGVMALAVPFVASVNSAVSVGDENRTRSQYTPTSRSLVSTFTW